MNRVGLTMGLTVPMLLGACVEHGARDGTAGRPDAGAASPATDAPAAFARDLNNSVHGGFVEPAGIASSAISQIPGEIVPVFVEDAPPGLNPRLWQSEVAAAWRAWSQVMHDIGEERRFVRVARREDARVVIGVRPADHADDCDLGFSDPDATVGHAFEYAHACLAGELHLNGDLRWVLDGVDRPDTYDVRTVVMHELGHLLGLGHSDVPGHIMSPEYAGARRALDQREAETLRLRMRAASATEGGS